MQAFCEGDTSEFPPAIKLSHLSNLNSLGAPIGTYFSVLSYSALKRTEVMKLSRLEEVDIGGYDTSSVVWELL